MTGLEVSEEGMNWMLDESNPSIRYHVLTEILGRKESDPGVIEARDKIPTSLWVKEIFQSQKANTYWETPQNCYIPKWTATVWRLIVLADLGVPGEDRRIKNACEHFLKIHGVSAGGFSVFPTSSKEFKPHICLTGNMVRTLIRFGYSNDGRVLSAINWLLASQQSDGGWDCFKEGARGHSSFSSSIQPLWALSEINPRTGEIDRAIERGIKFFLRHKLYKSDRTDTPIMLDWTRFHYPLHYRYDILHALRVITGLGIVKDGRLDDPIELLVSKAHEGGRWILDAVPRGWHIPEPWHSADEAYRPEEREVVDKGWGGDRTLQLEEAGQPSKIITLNALRVLKRTDKLKLAGSLR